MSEIAFFALLALALLLGPWVGLLALSRRLRRHQSTMEERLSLITQRIFDVESGLRDVQRSAKQ